MTLTVAHAWLTFRPLETYSGPGFQIQGHENSRWPQPLQIAWISITLKKVVFFFFRFESCVVFKCSGLVSLYSNDGCVILKPIFSYIPCNRKKNLETRHEYSMGGSGEKAAQRLLNSCFDMRVCATLWIIYCWKHSYSTEYWCQMQSGGTKKFLSLLRWATCRQFLFFCCCGQRKNFGPDSCSSQCTIQLGCDSMHAKCKTLHSLAFFKPIACAFWQ